MCGSENMILRDIKPNMQVTHSPGSDTWGVGSCFVFRFRSNIYYLGRDSSKKLVESKCASDARALDCLFTLTTERNHIMNKFIKFVLTERGVHFFVFTLAAAVAGFVNFVIGICQSRSEQIIVGAVMAILFGFLALVNFYCVKEDWEINKEAH